MLLLSIYISIAIGISFICSVLEAVLLSISPSYIAQLKQQGHPASAQLDKLKADIDRPLASILTLNTIAHTIGAATAGAQAAVVFGSEALGIFSAVLTPTCTSCCCITALDGMGTHPVRMVLRTNH